jgi:DNA-binding beta-propeller fold protein YncE
MARRALRGALAGSVAVLLAARSNNGISGSGGSAAPSGPPSAPQPRTVAMGLNPQTATLDPATHTLYADDTPENAPDGAVYGINASTCNALQASGCGINNTPEVQAGYRPVTIAVDQVTNTIYVVHSADNTVSVINGATCNAQNTSGCSHTPPAVKVGSNPST